MQDSMITIEHLSKKYLLGHQNDEREKYVALRDVIGRELRSFADGAKRFLRGHQLVSGRKSEDFWALRDVNFEVKAGEVIGIIGKNGAGKSTLLKILSRITEPTEGRIMLRGRVGSLLEVGTGFHPELTGRENIFLNGAILGMSKQDVKAKFDEIVEFASVTKFLDTPVKRYSSGMYVRLAFAVAANLEPDILIIDEVLAVGDAEFQKKCLGKMSDVARGGRTILFVSHNHGAVRNLCSHAIVLSEGTCSPKQSVESAIHEYTAFDKIDAGSLWQRGNSIAKAVQFEKIEVSVRGRQPKLRLDCRISLRFNERSRRAFIAVDISDHNFVPLMQAIPSFTPFIGEEPGVYEIELQIDLPGLIPDKYSLDFWLGPHNTETFDHVKNVVSVTIEDGPSEKRSFPHSSDHGFMVPESYVRISSSPNLLRT
jgi:lipopolysaccharide transport system ATP-binding protein